MIKCHLSTLMGAKRLKIADVVRDAGINRNTVTRLYHETNNRIEYDTLEKLCKYLDCKIEDLLEIVEDAPSTDSD
ncbi:helix-turn-helix domain-containing protein [Vibrio fluminensis]|uniref:helix-turn-helix domain-containing protein n=1 Tax=Vibrio fluminensis TaxID=2783614 RepID=UPI001886C01F|nr:helix-turn-helix transcriptional regulator [Vibrio fluminensis]